VAIELANIASYTLLLPVTNTALSPKAARPIRITIRVRIRFSVWLCTRICATL